MSIVIITNSWIAFATLLYTQQMLRKQDRQNNREFEEATTPARNKDVTYKQNFAVG